MVIWLWKSQCHTRPNQLTTAWLLQREQKKEIQSTQQHSVPDVSSPVGQNNSMEANHQAAANFGPQMSRPVPTRLPTRHSWLARNLQMISLAGPLLKSSVSTLSSLSRAHMLECQNTETAGSGNTSTTAQKVTLMVAASCPHRKNLLTLTCFLPFIHVLTWKWSRYDRWERKGRMDRWQKNEISQRRLKAGNKCRAAEDREGQNNSKEKRWEIYEKEHKFPPQVEELIKIHRNEKKGKKSSDLPEGRSWCWGSCLAP